MEEYAKKNEGEGGTKKYLLILFGFAIVSCSSSGWIVWELIKFFTGRN